MSVFFALIGQKTRRSMHFLANRRSHKSPFEKPISTSDMPERDDGTVSQFVVVTHFDIRVGARLSFARTADKQSYIDYEGPSVPVRSPTLVEFTERYGRHIEELGEREKEAKTTVEKSPVSESAVT